MPDAPLTPDRRRTVIDPDTLDPPPRAPFVELSLASCFSFLRGASDAVDLVMTARNLGYDAIGIADVNSMAGVVRVHTEATTLKLKPVIGCRIETTEGLAFLAYPIDRAAYGRLCRLISTGRMATPEGAWQQKGVCQITLAMLAAQAEGVQLVLVPPSDLECEFDIEAEVEGNVIPLPPAGGVRGGPELGASSSEEPTPDPSRKREGSSKGGPQQRQDNVVPIFFPSASEEEGGGVLPQALRPMEKHHPQPPPLKRGLLRDFLPHLTAILPTLRHIAASYLYTGDDIARINALDALAQRHGLAILATNEVLYASPDRRPLQDVMTAIRHKTTVARAGMLLHPNAERHLKSPEDMVKLFAAWPHAIAAARDVADACRFNLKELEYEYPEDIYPEGLDPQAYLERLTWQGATRRYPDGVPHGVRETLLRELELYRKLVLARYLLTIKDIVDFARNQSPPILCQGRGSAANSAVCYCLEITSVDPAKHALLFDRFISEERREPPDIDVDFEHERREEVIQYIYDRYGRTRAGLCATVIHYRPRMAIREVGKAMGLSEDVTGALARTVWGGWGGEIGEKHVAETGMDVTDPHLRRVLTLAAQMIGMPRHLSQHVGGFILTQNDLTETVPIGNGAMPDRSFIEWDKDDIDELRILKVDVLALGMLTCIRKCLDLLGDHHDRHLTLATVPREDPATYEMLRRGDSLGVFQVESRAQMNMLPRLRPREFYDLVIQVAIVRPGPIQGDMVHPYLKRRRGAEPVTIPSPAPEHGLADELSSILARTLGVPIFQEQAMKIALDAAKFSSKEANQLRKAMATFRSRGMVDALQDRMVERMVERGYDREFSQRCFNQIKGFGEYGFPESHAASFAHLVYVSSWLKCHFPAAFGCALLNSQPMGFYAPAQIVRDAREHGVAVLPVDVNFSDWDCTLEDVGNLGPLPLAGGAGGGRGLGAGSEEGPTPNPSRSREGSSKDSPSRKREGGRKGSPLRLREELSHPSGRIDAHIALRLGLRQIDGFPEAAAVQLATARRDGPFADVAALRERAGLTPALIERLAAGDAMGSLGLTRRQALWDTRSLIAAPDLPLFAAARQKDPGARDEGAEAAATRLPAMPLSEEVVADYQTQRLSLKAHPLAFLREGLTDRGFVRAADLRARKFRSTVQVAGVVLIRQRPGSAKGVCFITIEDETGVANIVVWPHLKEKHRRVVMGSRLMEVRGRVEYDDEVIHVIAAHMHDASQDLRRLSEDLLPTTIARADHCNNPLPGKFGPKDDLRSGKDDPFAPRDVEWTSPPVGSHPRDVRVIPKSRDFH